MVGGRAAWLSACCVLVLCGCGGRPAPPKDVVIDRTSATGKHAAAEASGKAGRFSTISVRVRATPNQRVTGSWTIACRSGTASSRDADDFSGRTPLTVPMSAVSFTNADCTLVADGSLTGSGRLTVELLGH
jgi:hypothetical protein